MKVDAWLLRRGSIPSVEGKYSPLVLGTVQVPAPGSGDVLIEPLYGCWEGNMGHAMAGVPVDICAQRGEPEVVLGNAGVVRVIEVGSDVRHVRPGDECIFFGGGQLDRFGYMELAHGYDLQGSIGLLARRTLARAHNVLPIPRGTRHSLPQWAAFSLRYVTAWSNWRLAIGCYRLQVDAGAQPAPHVWSWGGGTSLAELELARSAGCRPVLLSGSSAHLDAARRRGIVAVDRREIGDLEIPDDFRQRDGTRRREYAKAERRLRDIAAELTDGEGVSIFLDYIGAPVWRASWRILGRASVVASGGWKAGAELSYNRAAACIKRTQFIHTHYASVREAIDAMEFAEREGWMPEVGEVWPWERIGELATAYLESRIDSYFPVFAVAAAEDAAVRREAIHRTVIES